MFGIGGTLGSVLDFGGDILTGGAISNNEAIKETNQQNIKYAEGQTQFQERMSNSAYQRATEDMRKAGLNPMLAYSQGGASTPTGASPTLTAPRPGDVGRGLADTAKSIATMSPQIQNVQSQTELNKASASTQNATASNLGATTKQAAATTKKIEAETSTAKAKAKEAELNLEIQEARQPYDKASAPLDAVSERIDNIASTIMKFFGHGSSGKSHSQPPTTFNPAPLRSRPIGSGRDRYKTETKALERAGAKGILLP